MGDKPAEASEKPDWGAILKANFGGLSLIGIFVGSISIMNIIVRHGEIGLKGIVNEVVNYYHRFIHVSIDRFIDYVNANFKFPFKIPNIDDYHKDIIFLGIVGVSIAYRTIDAKRVDLDKSTIKSILLKILIISIINFMILVFVNIAYQKKLLSPDMLNYIRMSVFITLYVIVMINAVFRKNRLMFIVQLLSISTLVVLLFIFGTY